MKIKTDAMEREMRKGTVKIATMTAVSHIFAGEAVILVKSHRDLGFQVSWPIMHGHQCQFRLYRHVACRLGCI